MGSIGEDILFYSKNRDFTFGEMMADFFTRSPPTPRQVHNSSPIYRYVILRNARTAVDFYSLCIEDIEVYYSNKRTPHEVLELKKSYQRMLSVSLEEFNDALQKASADGH